MRGDRCAQHNRRPGYTLVLETMSIIVQGYWSRFFVPGTLEEVAMKVIWIGLGVAVTLFLVVVAFSSNDGNAPASTPHSASPNAIASTQASSSVEGQASIDTENDPGEAKNQVPDELRSEGPPDSSEAVVAKELSVVPGALVCPNFQAVQSVFQMYTDSWEEKMQDAVTRGQSQLVRGRAVDAPDLNRYGCVLLPAGTPMKLEPGKLVPVVQAKMSGTWIRGVTLGGMFISQEEASKRDATIAAAKAFLKSMQDIRPDFQRQLPLLKEPAPDLRWYQTTDGSILVTPYGPCMMVKRDADAYLLREVKTYTAYGPYASQADAENTAVQTCSLSLQATSAASSQTDPLWFPRAQQAPESPSTVTP